LLPSGSRETLSQPDDLAALSGQLYVVFQTAAPAGAQAKPHTYEPSFLPHGRGTDAVSIFDGRLLVRASAPTVPDGPVVYVADLVGGTAFLRRLFNDNAIATVADAGSGGQQTPLALTDPDSSKVVPGQAPRFQGDYVHDSQGDQQQVSVHELGAMGPDLQVLNLSQSINDTAWATDRGGTLYVTDKSNGDVVAVRGAFRAGTAYVAVTPCSANSAPATCPAPGFPANYLGTLDLFTGDVQPALLLAGSTLQPQGLLFVGTGVARTPGAQGNEG
jgi:hypothetical protein